jgi:hypothetical protein
MLMVMVFVVTLFKSWLHVTNVSHGIYKVLLQVISVVSSLEKVVRLYYNIHMQWYSNYMTQLCMLYE